MSTQLPFCTFDQMVKTVSTFDSSASWVDISRCEIESSYTLMIFSTLYHELVCHVEHYMSNIENAINENPTTKVPPMAYFEL